MSAGSRSGNEVVFREFAARDLDWLVELHDRLYREDEGFDDTFGSTVSSVLKEFLHHHDPCLDRGWVALGGEARIGSIFCVNGGDEGIAKLRLFLLIREARGQGLGYTMLQYALAFARSAGYRRVQVSTYSSHRAACALYARSGFLRTRSIHARAFGRDLVEERWELVL